MENMTVMETVDFTIRVAKFMEWYSFIWGCIGWAVAFRYIWLRLKEGGELWT